MKPPAIADSFKRNIIAETATRLAATHGRRKMYSSAEVQAAMTAARFPAAWTVWGVAVFCTDAEFGDFCAAQGLTANYNNTRLDALRFLDKPAPTGSVAAKPAIAAGAALTSAVVVAGPYEKKNESALSSVADAADVVVDVVGGIFDALDIFS